MLGEYAGREGFAGAPPLASRGGSCYLLAPGAQPLFGQTRKSKGFFGCPTPRPSASVACALNKTGWAFLGVAFSICSVPNFWRSNRIDPNEASRAVFVKPETAPRPIRRMSDQSPLHRIQMHVQKLLRPLFVTPDIEVIETSLPKMLSRSSFYPP